MYSQRIRYFLKAAEAGSFFRAAEQLFLSPQALIKQINLLEEEIGRRLFVRSRRGAALTPLGEYALAQFSRLDREYAHVMQELKRQAGTQKKQIRMGIFSSLPQDELVSPVLSFLLSRYPEYAISLEIRQREELADLHVRSQPVRRDHFPEISENRGDIPGRPQGCPWEGLLFF